LFRVSSGLSRLNVKHFVGGPEAGGFVQAAAFLSGMKSHNPDPAAASFRKREVDEIAGEMAAAIILLNVNVEQVSAGGRARVERVRGPVKQEQTRSGNNRTVIFGEPAKVAAIRDGLRDPWLVSLRHELEHLIVPASGIDKHAATMTGDE
jgi:hypothetical protein